jgi:hypothetical protein
MRGVMADDQKSKPILVRSSQLGGVEMSPLSELSEIFQAEQELLQIPEDEDRAWYSYILAYRLSLGKQWRKAEEIAHGINEEFGFDKVEAFLKIANEMFNDGLTEGARINLARATPVATQSKMVYSWQKAESLDSIASLLNRLNSGKEAVVIWEKAIEAAVTSQLEDGTDGARRLRTIAMNLALTGNFDMAVQAASLISIEKIRTNCRNEVLKIISEKEQSSSA